MKNWEGHKEVRLFNSMRNTFWTLIGQVFLVLIGLFLRRVLLQTVGTENLGLNYLFNDIVNLLSVAELGLTGVIAYHLYEPLSTKNDIKIKKIMIFFRKAYAFIGFVVCLLGIVVIPFLGYLVGETTLSYNYITIVFILFLARSVVGFLFSYKQILLHADQKAYIITITDLITTVVYTLIAIVVLIHTKNFIYVIALEIIKKIINDIIIRGIVNKKYPYMKVKDSTPIEKEEIKRIGIDVKDAFISRVSKSVIKTTDNIIISIFLGIATTGLFSNYAIVLYTIENIVKQLLKSTQASVGNLLVEENGIIIYSVLKKITFVSFFIISISGSCLLFLSTPFVALWFGNKYIMSEYIVLICVFNIFLYIIQLTIVQFAEAGGLFQQTKKIDLYGCFLNILMSVIGVQIFGIIGVFLATFISRVLQFFLRTKIVFQEILDIHYANYLRQITGYFICFIVELLLVKLILSGINIQYPVIKFIVYGMFATLVPLITNIFLYHSSENYIYMMKSLKFFLHTNKK